MANIGGPNKPADPSKGAKVLQLRKPETERLDPAKVQAQTPPAAKTVETPPAPASDNFAKVGDKAAGSTVVPDMHEDMSLAQQGSKVPARFAAMGALKTAPIKTASKDQLRVRDGSGGKIMEGSLVVESAKGLQKLEGVVRISGDLTVQEARLTGADATPVMSLVEIGGRLTIEGVSS